MAKKAGRVSRGGGKRRWLALLLILVGILAAAGAYLFFQVTADVETRLLDPGDGLDLAEANRKLKVLDDATKRQAKGFIRLSEPEINAHLAHVYKGATNKLPGGLAHQRTAINLGPDHITLFSWVGKDIPLMPVKVAWQRTFELKKTGALQQFRLTSMKLGNLAIPPEEWDRVYSLLGAVDSVYTNELGRLAKLPALELRSVAGGRGFEARLYNYDPTLSSVIPGMPPVTNVNGSLPRRR
ncbi:MAG TPA: hypothetical protein VEH27_07285 [Methylomirabilota bacterium]|nr:hypothetical protein [Methylomirabilota bacterium]